MAQGREGTIAVRLTAKERILLHLLGYVTYREALEVPPEMTQDGVATAAWVELRHLSQYLRPLLRDELVRERTCHVKGIRQRRKVYDLTEAGQHAAYRLRDRVRAETVRVQDGHGGREETVAKALESLGGRVSLLDLVRRSMQAGIVDLDALVVAPASVFVERLGEAPRLDRFVGREAELAVLTSEAGPRVIVIRGVPGIGKTSLAAKACERLRGRRSLFWHRLRSWDTRESLLAALGEFLAAGGRPGLRSVLVRGESMRADGALREDLPGTRSLLVMDDAQEADAGVVSFLRFLKDVVAGTPDVRLLVLTRRAIPFYDRRDVTVRHVVGEVDLTGLSASEVEALLGPSLDRWFAHIVRELGGHPLFLELARASARPGASGSVLRDVHRFMEEEVYRELSESERSVMKVACLYHVPVPREAFFAGVSESHDAVISLVNRALLQPIGPSSFGAHDTIREFFASILTPSEREALARFAVGQLRALAGSARESGDPVACVGYLSNAVSVATATVERVFLLEALGDANERLGDLPGALTAYKEAVKLATDVAEISRLHRKIGRAFEVRGDLGPALREVEAGFAVLGESQTAERGWLHIVRCGAETKLEEWQEAREHGAAALGIFRALCDLRGQAQALLELGDVELHSPAGDPLVAERYLTSALELSAYLKDTEFAARVHITLAHLYGGREGRADQALRHVAAVEALLPSIGDPHIRRSFLMLQGWLHLDLVADFATSEARFQEALVLARRIHDPTTVVFAGYGLATNLFFRRRFEEADRALESFARDVQSLGMPAYAIEALEMIAECAFWRDDLSRVEWVLGRVRAPGLASGRTARPHLVGVLEGLGCALARDTVGCRRTFEEALGRAKHDARAREPSVFFFLHFFYGVALDALGDPTGSETHLREAESLLEESGFRARLAMFPEARSVYASFLRQRCLTSSGKSVPPAA